MELSGKPRAQPGTAAFAAAMRASTNKFAGISSRGPAYLLPVSIRSKCDGNMPQLGWRLLPCGSKMWWPLEL